MVAMFDRVRLVKLIEAVRKRPIAFGFPVNLVFCTLIGLIVGYFNQRLVASLAVSYCIGFSIMIFQIIGHRWLGTRLSGKVITPVFLVIGFLTGELLAGVLVFDQLFFLISNVTYGLALGFLIGALTLIGLYFLGSFASTAIELSNAEATMAKQAQAVAVAELKALQAQVEPHFLFNTLANIHSLIAIDPKHASAMLEKLSDFLRTTLEYSRKESTTLSAEIDFSKAYLDVQGARLQDRLDYKLYIASQLESIKVPPLILQPLIENAVIHGIEPKPEGGTIVVRAHADQETLYISVDDDGDGLDSDLQFVSGTGLNNLRERLDTWYQGNASVNVTSKPDGGTMVELSVPLVGSS